MFKTQQLAVLAAFAQVVGSAFPGGKVELAPEVRTKIGDLLLAWFNEGKWTIKSERCNQGEGLLKYIGGNPQTAMKCNIIDNFLCRDKAAEKAAAKSEPVANTLQVKIQALKELHAAGTITQEQLVDAMLKLA